MTQVQCGPCPSVDAFTRLFWLGVYFSYLPILFSQIGTNVILGNTTNLYTPLSSRPDSRFQQVTSYEHFVGQNNERRVHFVVQYLLEISLNDRCPPGILYRLYMYGRHLDNTCCIADQVVGIDSLLPLRICNWNLQQSLQVYNYRNCNIIELYKQINSCEMNMGNNDLSR